ncbi:hypothetical protein SEPCBS119000_003602 [Sporothrix epigloea]|uniref:Transcription elongation factor 1 homolog n=1 Tax=Sporothrix epigloea TaxID=1892477 RepID=A0ABP0DNS9_9PEZI
MGKRKSSSKPQGPKKADPLPTTFTCLFCNHEKSVTVKLDKKLGIGYLEYSVAQEKVESERSRGRLDSSHYATGRAGASLRDLEEDDEDDF